jgi:uncharacterized protein
METRERIIQLLREKQPYLAHQYHVRRIGLFGSHAAGSPDENSDIDLIVELDGPVGFRFIELSEYLEDLLGRKVDLLTRDGLRGIRVPRVAREIEESIAYV